MKSAAASTDYARENQAIQRNQFEAEKKVAVADTSIENPWGIAQIQEEQQHRRTQLQQLETDRAGKSEELEQKKTDLQAVAGTS